MKLFFLSRSVRYVPILCMFKKESWRNYMFDFIIEGVKDACAFPVGDERLKTVISAFHSGYTVMFDRVNNDVVEANENVLYDIYTNLKNRVVMGPVVIKPPEKLDIRAVRRGDFIELSPKAIVMKGRFVVLVHHPNEYISRGYMYMMCLRVGRVQSSYCCKDVFLALKRDEWFSISSR